MFARRVPSPASNSSRSPASVQATKQEGSSAVIALPKDVAVKGSQGMTR